jgi:hypothetical protein
VVVRLQILALVAITESQSPFALALAPLTGRVTLALFQGVSFSRCSDSQHDRSRTLFPQDPQLSLAFLSSLHLPSQRVDPHEHLHWPSRQVVPSLHYVSCQLPSLETYHLDLPPCHKRHSSYHRLKRTCPNRIACWKVVWRHHRIRSMVLAPLRRARCSLCLHYCRSTILRIGCFRRAR